MPVKLELFYCPAFLC